LEVLFIFNPTTPPLQKKICAKCHVLDIVVAPMNCDVHCNVWCETTIKKVSFSPASIVPTIGDLVIFTIEGKWLEIVVGMLESNFLIQPCAIQVQILIKTKL
jgi:hypothetical protein